MSHNTAISLIEKPFTPITFADDLLTDNFCNWVLEEMYTGGEMKSYSAKMLCNRFNIPADQITTVVALLAEKEFIQTTANAADHEELHLTWQGKNYLEQKFAATDTRFSPLYTAHKKKAVNPYLVAGAILAFIAIAWLIFTQVL